LRRAGPLSTVARTGEKNQSRYSLENRVESIFACHRLFSRRSAPRGGGRARGARLAFAPG
jgi:hypothetical protein